MSQSRGRKLRKLIFLDFDGVLHPSIGTIDERFCRISLLEDAVGGSGCRIVISSSWRFHYSFQTLLRRFPQNLQSLIEGCTGPAVVGRHARYQEIVQYMGDVDDYDWLALDDSKFEFPDSCHQLVHCNGAIGLTQAEVKKLQMWLAGCSEKKP
jgi:hypothetical protein